MQIPSMSHCVLGLVSMLMLGACAHAREVVYLEPGRAVDLKQLDLHKQSLVVPLTAGEVLPLDVVVEGDFVTSQPQASLELRVKQDCFVRVDDRGLRLSTDRNFDAKTKRKGSFQLGLGVTERGKRVTLHVVTPSRIP
ncbi:MAG TPA: hypothetical protein VFZ61_04520 [Polyangiales bacterium]